MLTRDKKNNTTQYTTLLYSGSSLFEDNLGQPIPECQTMVLLGRETAEVAVKHVRIICIWMQMQSNHHQQHI